MANSQSEGFTRTVGVLNSCGINLIIPAVVSQLGKISSEDPNRNSSFDEEYNKLLGHFNSHYESNLNIKQLHDFLASKSYFEQQFILDAVLRQYMVENLIKEAEKDKVSFEDNVTRLTTWENYDAVVSSEPNVQKETENSVHPGKYPMMPYDQAIKNLFQPLGHNCIMNDFNQETANYQERQHSIKGLESPISTVQIYGKDDHYELAMNVQDDKNLQASPYTDIRQRLSLATELNISEKMKKTEFDLVTNRVNDILSESKELTQLELGKFLSLESDSIAGYTPKQVEELRKTFKGDFIRVKDLLHKTMNLDFDQNEKTVTENDYKQLKDQYKGDVPKHEIEKLDEKMAMQLQAEEIKMFKNPLKNSIQTQQTHTSDNGSNSQKAKEQNSEQKDDPHSRRPK